jgi:dTDP-4-amino-4,6-dideoxygalactose transaminase/acetyltransferase-like isoleucine patch superfamily enzyme
MSPPYVHPSAIVDEGASIGEDAQIWHFVHVSAGARIGRGCVLGQNVFVGRGVRLGDRVKVQNNVSIYEGVEIEDEVFLGPSCVFTNVNNPRSFVSRKSEYRPTRVGRGATIGANATIVCGHVIGEYAFVGAGAVVTRDVPPYALVVGNPARRIGWVSRVGERLPPGPRPVCPRTGERYVIEGERCRPAAPGEDEGEAGTDEEKGDDDRGPIPLLDLQMHHAPLLPAIRAAIDRVLVSGRYILGEEVESFERECAQYVGVRHAIGVSSGTDGLLLAMMGLGIGPGDEVITTAFSFFATAGSIARLGARPVFVDVERETLLLDPARVEAAITPRTRAIVPVHLYGRPCDFDALDAIAKRHGISTIEDAAQAFGATTPRGRVGSLGRAAAFSFFPSKNVGALGDGGLVTTNDDALAERMRKLRHHGMSPKYVHQVIGGNFRLDALQAAVLRVKLPYADAWADGRRRVARLYNELFAEEGLPRALLATPEIVPGHVFHQYVVRTPFRDALRARLAERGIATEVYYPLGLHLQPAFASLGYRAGDMPETERACREVLALPIQPELGEARVRRIVREVARALRALAGGSKYYGA